MRELGETDPALLVRLEGAIGAPRFLRLIRANGTVFELFMVLDYATSGFRTALLEQLTSEQAEALINKTVAEARSIEALHFTLRSLSASSDQLTRLEELVGVAGWWRLLIACGNLNSVWQITLAMSSDFREQVIAAATKLSIPDWCVIIASGLFLNACEFTTNELRSYPEVARNAFRVALKETATTLATRASWFDLNPSRPPAEPENAEGIILRAALRTRTQALQLAELVGLDCREAANALAFCWRERPDLRPELGKNVRNILPSRGDWPRGNGEFGAFRLVLDLARDTEFPEEDARWLLAEGISFLDREVCAGIHTLPLFELVWTMAALSYERVHDGSFAFAFPQTTQEALLDVLADRIRTKGPNPEKLAQCALAGLLFFLFPQYRRRLAQLLAPLKGPARWLADMALQQSFVPALFALEGIALQVVREGVFNPWVCSMLLLQFGTEKNDSPALKRLRLRVSQQRDKKSSR